MPIPRVYYSNVANIALCVEKIESQEVWGYIGYVKLKDSERREGKCGQMWVFYKVLECVLSHESHGLVALLKITMTLKRGC